MNAPRLTMIVLLSLFIFGVLGFVGHADRVAEDHMAAADVCRYQAADAAPSYDQCITNQLEKNGDK